MALKRKRSASELAAAFNSPARSDSSAESFDFPLSPSLAFPRAFATPSHLSSRTIKRFRDNRPSEEEVHQRTLNLLYSAQQHPEQIPAEPSPPPAPAPVPRGTQKSLHSFWNIGSSAPRISAASRRTAPAGPAGGTSARTAPSRTSASGGDACGAPGARPGLPRRDPAGRRRCASSEGSSLLRASGAGLIGITAQ
ncbi:orf21 protein [Colletotrichum plurivorum]|uniref:Orf21 protein n=1 Tax=Colletotrichum plurivorum TaxID=2175906 RepID=A0A8H6MU92_9PEZI|nr:orf21 protein [Colletotrichum plurivorum]